MAKRAFLLTNSILIESYSYYYYYWTAIIIDRFLITGKERGKTRSNKRREYRNVHISKLHDKQMMSQKGMIKYLLGLWRKQRLELEFFILIIWWKTTCFLFIY